MKLCEATQTGRVTRGMADLFGGSHALYFVSVAVQPGDQLLSPESRMSMQEDEVDADTRSKSLDHFSYGLFELEIHFTKETYKVGNVSF